jgi:hypothetical protein
MKFFLFTFLGLALLLNNKSFAQPGGPGGAGAIYQYWNSTISKHFYTNNFYELGAGASGFVFEKVAFRLVMTAPGSGITSSKPVYRYFSPGSNPAHYYTTNFGVTPLHFDNYEGILGYTPSPPLVMYSVYEFFNSSGGDYYYSTSSNVPAGYVLNGVAFTTYGN